jgi:hypothetical protein
MIIFAAGVASTIMMLVGIGLLAYTLLRKSHHGQATQYRTRVSHDVARLPRSKPTWQTSDTSVNAAEIARDLNGQLTTKMVVLEQLIADSQKQIERMEELLERIEAVKKDS